jgi:hypothetical protein
MEYDDDDDIDGQFCSYITNIKPEQITQASLKYKMYSLANIWS